MGNHFEETEKWAAERLDEMLLVDRFKEMGKADDLVFQALVFLGNGSHQLSLGTTVLRGDEEIPAELKGELKDIQQRLHDYQGKLRRFRKGGEN
ncbi:hypothetical protein [Sporosarcina sp. FSL K6-1508]|uniref:hypothetical protein n=1 Tax=Sporosarcina sp. FSL K6-1508 TaxID=2921553 RepID=UPI0030F5962E